MDTPAQTPLDDHVEDSVEALADLHRDHHAQSSRLQNGVDRITDLLGRPVFALLLTAGVALWAYAALRSGEGVHGPVFAWLELAATISALFIAVLILITQRRENQLSDRRSQLTLEMAILADKKTAKVIALLEELRRDAPAIRDRVDAETQAMEKPVDPREVLDAIESRDFKAEPR